MRGVRSWDWCGEDARTTTALERGATSGDRRYSQYAFSAISASRMFCGCGRIASSRMGW